MVSSGLDPAISNAKISASTSVCNPNCPKAMRQTFSRGFHASPPLFHGPPPDPSAPAVPVTFVSAARGADRPASSVTVPATIGASLLSVAQAHDIELEGACEGVCACSTCHLILSQDTYDALPEPSEDEEDMLDCAVGLTPTSRLGCQCTVDETWTGAEVEVPGVTRNFYVDGHVPQPH